MNSTSLEVVENLSSKNSMDNLFINNNFEQNYLQ